MSATEAERHAARRTWLDTAEAAEQLGNCSRSHVRRLIRLGYLRAYNAGLPGGARADWRFRQEWIDEYLKRQTRVPKAMPKAS